MKKRAFKKVSRAFFQVLVCNLNRGRTARIYVVGVAWICARYGHCLCAAVTTATATATATSNHACQQRKCDQRGISIRAAAVFRHPANHSEEEHHSHRQKYQRHRAYLRLS